MLKICYSNKCQVHISCESSNKSEENIYVFKIDNKWHVNEIIEFLKDSYETYDIYKGREDIVKIIDKANTIIFHIEK
jgi:hypothetical protein